MQRHLAILILVCTRIEKYIVAHFTDENNLKEAVEEDKDTPLSDALKAALGDPRESSSIKLSIHAALVRSWKVYMSEGLPEKDREDLLSKYEVADGLQAPILNDAIQGKLVEKYEKTLKKDNYRFEAQKVSAIALTTLSAAITMVNEAEQE